MPWKETSPMRERIEFWKDYQRGVFRFTELCELHGISRKTGYKLIARILAEGLDAAIRDRSRAPKHSPQRIDDVLADALLEFRRKHPRWGPRKILGHFADHVGPGDWPAASTVGELFRRHGLTRPRRRRPRPGHPGRPSVRACAPNDLWSIDFKGQARTGDGLYCYPLTLMDRASRFNLEIRGMLGPKSEPTRNAVERVFRDCGLPAAMLMDNGEPFASQALHRLSRFSVWLMRLGIEVVLIQPGHPEQNGSHERFHRTLKQETMRPPGHNCRAQQRRFDSFRREYNDLRPHEALGNKTPASVYRASSRPFPRRLPPIEYPGHFEVRKVSENGGIRWKHHFPSGPNHGWVNVSTVLAGEYLGLEEVDDGIWTVYFGPVLIGRFDEWELRIYGAHPRNRPL